MTMTGRHSSEQSEEDVQDDPHVAGARDDEEGDGGYVGRTASDDDIDAGQTGAEERADN